MIDLVKSLLRDVASFGRDPNGGWTRLGFSAEDRAARAWFADKMRECGLVVRQDAFGNLFGRLPGHDDALPAVATGSHLDTVPNGGNYDGILGCLSGLAALRDIGRSGGCRHPLELILFQIEESTRFGCSTLGSKMLCGLADAGLPSTLKDRDGKLLSEVMSEAGLDGDMERLSDTRCREGAYKAFVELHMDQGPTLEDAGLPLGVITHIVGVRRARIQFQGRGLHAGGTPMQGRRDACVAASEAVIALSDIAGSFEGRYGMVGTTGAVKVMPGAINVIPATAVLQCEMRSADDDDLKAGWQAFTEALHAIAARRGTPVEILLTESCAPVPMDSGLQTILRQTCARLNARSMDMQSGAGHDCMNMARVMPSAMLFVRSVDGISHQPEECVREEDMALACATLRDTLKTLGA